MNSSASRARLRWLYLPWAIASVIFFAYLLVWHASASRMKSAVNDWAEDQREDGVAVSYNALKSDGFPFFLRVHVEHPEIAFTNQLRWSSDRLTIDALPYDLSRLIFSTRSEQQVRFSDGSEWRFGASDFRVSIASDKQREWKLAVSVADAIARRSDGVTASLQHFVMDLSPAASDVTIIAANLAADGLRVKAPNREFGLDSIQTTLAASQVPLMADMHSWRDAGGTLLINGFIATQGDARFSLSGDLAPDQHLNPAGAFHAEITSPATFVSLLADAGAINKANVESVSSTLTLAAIAGGGKLAAPIILKDGVVQLAGVTIAELSSLE